MTESLPQWRLNGDFLLKEATRLIGYVLQHSAAQHVISEGWKKDAAQFIVDAGAAMRAERDQSPLGKSAKGNE